MNIGVICSLTNQLADFEENCNSYIEDPKLKQAVEANKTENEILHKTVSLEKRLANCLIDLVVIFVLSSISAYVFFVVLGVPFSIFSPSSLSLVEKYPRSIDYLFKSIIGIIYYSVFEATTGRTVGKFITKTKVVNEKGEKPNFGMTLIRSLCRYIPFEPLSFLGSDNSGWHDKLSKTKVIEN